MLLILSAASFRRVIKAGKGGVTLLDLPRLAHEELGFRGLLMPTDLLVGSDAADLDRFRERADKAACPCLFLVEAEPRRLGDAGDSGGAWSARLERVLLAAQRLGCSAAALSVAGEDDDDAIDRAAMRLRPLATRAERLDVSLLLSPCAGLTGTPERVTELIKKIGGFRVGSMPDFQAAAESGDSTGYLRRLAPYAPVVIGSALDFDDAGEHSAYSLSECAEALCTVGYDGAVALEFRGSGDVSKGLLQMREALEPILIGSET